MINEQPDFAELFIAHLLVRNTRVEADLVHLLFAALSDCAARKRGGDLAILLILSRRKRH